MRTPLRLMRSDRTGTSSMGYELVNSNLHCGDFHKLYMDYTIAVEGLIRSYHLICIKGIHNGAAIVKQGMYCNHIYKWTIDICGRHSETNTGLGPQ